MRCMSYRVMYKSGLVAKFVEYSDGVGLELHAQYALYLSGEFGRSYFEGRFRSSVDSMLNGFLIINFPDVSCIEMIEGP